MRFTAILFDLDGTLIDTLEDIGDAMNHVLAEVGLPTHSMDKYRYFIGNGIDELVRRALPDHIRGKKMIRQAVLDMQDEYNRRWARKSKPYPGVASLLDACLSQGLKIAIISNKPDGPTQDMVEYFFPSRRMFSIVQGARRDVPKKPDPTGALMIAEQLGVDPAECILVGDMPVDMRTARAAGMYPVGALWGFRSGDELIAGGARLLAHQPLDLADWLR